MQPNAGSTQNLKGQTERVIYWEEPLPLKDLPEITPTQAGKQQITTPQLAESGTIPKKARFGLNKKIVLIFGISFVFLILVGGTINFVRQKKEREAKVQKLNSKSLPLPKTYSRLSSAFVPKIPSTEPAQLWLNWRVFEDRKIGFSLSYPEEWKITKKETGPIYEIFYQDNRQILAKLALILEEPQINLAEFLRKRYNLPNNLSTEITSPNEVDFKFDNTFVFAKSGKLQLFILEGKIADSEQFENFVPFFLNIGKSLQILE